MMLQRKAPRTPVWVLVASTLAVVFAGLGALAVFGAGVLPARTGPPVEELAVEQTVFTPGTIALTVRNVGPEPVTVAQVFVNDSFVDFTGGTGAIGRLRSTTLRLSYPWQNGQPYDVAMLTSTGLAIDHRIPVAVATPSVGPTSIGRMALLGAMIGIIPVLLGMTVLPLLRRTGPAAARVLLAVTVGLLAFLAVDALIEGFQLATGSVTAFGGAAVVVVGAALAFLALAAMDRMPRGRATGARLALLIATGIGLHNLGEGLAVGSAFAVGELPLAAALVVGFAIHNTTEGVAVIAPLTRAKVGPAALLGLGLVAGAPAVLGTVLGSTVTNPTLASFLLGLGVGAIARVVVQIVPLLRGPTGRILQGPVIGGLAGGVLVMYLSGLLVAA